MKHLACKRTLSFALSACMIFAACSKSGGSSSGGSGSPSGGTIFPLALNNTWNYKLKLYNTATGFVTDSSFFNLAITGTISVNGAVYYQFRNSVDTTTIETLANINSTTLGSIDSAYGVNYFTFFVSGTGDSTQSVDSWPVTVSKSGSTCQGTDKLYAHYVDTTLVNEDGTTYTQCMKNVIVTYDCSGDKSVANVYFIKQGVGIARYSRYIYNAEGKLLLESAWVLESESLN